LTIAEWKRFVDAIPWYTVVDINGGEAFLADHAMEKMEYFFQNHRLSTLITNGTTVSNRDIGRLLDWKIAYFMVSLDGLGDTHDRIRGMKGAFDRAVELLRRLGEARARRRLLRPIICVKTVITSDNHKDLIPLIEMCEQDLRVDEVHLAVQFENRFHMGFVPFKDMRHPNLYRGNSVEFPAEKKEAVKAALRDVIAFRRRSGLAVALSPEFRRDEDILEFIDDPRAFGVPRCNRPWTDLVMGPEGRVTSCVTFDLGNIRDYQYDVGSALRGKPASKWQAFFQRDGSFLPACEGCCHNLHERKRGN